jgi:hypothetical protein
MALAIYSSKRKALETWKVRTIMEKKHVIDKRSIKLEHVLKPDYLPFGSGRPEREKVIGNDDLMNLEIILNTTKSVEEFEKMI